MTHRTLGFSGFAPFVAAALLFMPLGGFAQNTPGPASGSSAPATASGKQERWLHVRVDNPDSKEETVRVNVPLELAEKVLPTINRNHLQSGRVKVDQFDCHGVDVRAL